jgi:hypothetical protein
MSKRPTATELARALQALVNAVSGRGGSVEEAIEEAMQHAEALLRHWRTGERPAPQPTTSE